MNEQSDVGSKQRHIHHQLMFFQKMADPRRTDPKASNAQSSSSQAVRLEPHAARSGEQSGSVPSLVDPAPMDEVELWSSHVP
jgi:hypothetical protein